MSKLFAVYLGGRAQKCNTELHDVVFAIGDTIEATYEQLMDAWFSTPLGLHIDSWMELSIVDGYRISLSESKATGGQTLYFVNLGGYADSQFTELHANIFLAAGNSQEAKSRAKSMLREKLPGHLHTDDLHDVDDCLEVGLIGALHIGLTPCAEKAPLIPVNGYHIIPEAIVQAYMERKGH
jgi:hypothetical protein